MLKYCIFFRYMIIYSCKTNLTAADRVNNLLMCCNT